MDQAPAQTCRNEWTDYYRKFPYFSSDAVREGCHPRIMERPGIADKSVVLVHGLTDSPYFMAAIGEHFFNTLGYNVYLPLLQAHGLKEPKGMEDADLEKWKENVAYAVECAKTKSKEVSIGGLSTGGTLSFHAGLTNPDTAAKWQQVAGRESTGRALDSVEANVDTAGLGAVGGYSALSNFTALGGQLTVFAIPD